jgi:hypothetical protein
MANRLSRDELVLLVRRILGGENKTAAEVDEWLLLFAINSPDPVRAMNLLIVPGGPETAEEIVDEALAYPRRDPKSLPISALHPDHELRKMLLE